MQIKYLSNLSIQYSAWWPCFFCLWLSDGGEGGGDDGGDEA